MLASLSRRTWWMLALAAGIAWFAALDLRLLQHPDEGRYGEIAREMAAGKDWVTPRLNDLKYFEKPPLQYWLGAAAFDLLGVNEWTARLPSAVAGFLAVIAVGFTAARLASPDAGAFAALVLAGTVWHAGIAHFLSVDSVLSFCMTLALCAFLLAQRPQIGGVDEPPRSPTLAAAERGAVRAPGRPFARTQRNWMLVAYAAAALATLAKGLVAIAIPGAALILYTLVTRDAGPWRRLHALPGLAVYFLVAAPWFVLVSRANPEFVQFFFVHEHVERFLTETHNRTGEWWYFVPWYALGIMPWTVVWAVTLPRSWRDAQAFANGFSWKRFCLVYAAFIFVFFSMSGSKLPSYILPMFPALALVLGFELTRLPARALMWIASPLAVGGLAALAAYGVAWDDAVPLLANDQTPEAIFRAFGPWVFAAIAAYTAGGIVAFLLFRHGSGASKTLGVAALSLASLVGMQVAFVGHDAFAVVRSAAPILREAERANGGPLDPRYPVFQVASYDQTLPFYLGRPTLLVEFRDEMALGLDAEPDKGYNLPRWFEAWFNAPQAYALMTRATAADLARERVPFRVLAEDPRRVFIARR
jgi:4-amino-4-deoxy-L-arabinose transferase-like glycosyltransferase